MTSVEEKSGTPADDARSAGVLQRAFAVIRALGASQAEGSRVTALAKAVGLTQATVHRLLQGLIAEGVVEQDEGTRRYRLSVDFLRSRRRRAIPAACARYAGPHCCGCAQALATPFSCS